MKAPKLGIVCSHQEISPYIQRVALRHRMSWGVTSNKYSTFDVLLIPDNIGIYVGLPALKGICIPDMPLDQYAEYFRLHLLDTYIKKDVFIIGVGQGGAMLAHYMGLTVGTSMDKYIFLHGEDIVTVFETDNMLIVPDINCMELHQILHEKLKIINEVPTLSNDDSTEVPQF